MEPVGMKRRDFIKGVAASGAVLGATSLFAQRASAQNEISFWTTETQEARIALQEGLAKRFGDASGIKVNVVPAPENELAQRVTAAFAAGNLGDVIFHPIDFTIGWAEQGILNTEAATTAINALGASSFSEGPLNLSAVDGGWAAVPADGWGQLVLYRKDLFDDKGLAPPASFSAMLAAAQQLHDGANEFYGIDVSSAPDQTFTQQVFEEFALANNAKLVDGAGNVNLNTPEMVETLSVYKSLNSFSQPGSIWWLQTRANFLARKSAMTVWSPFILDELAGLRDSALPVDNNVHKDTGIVTRLKGPNGQAQYGQVSFFGISADANVSAAQQWIQFLSTDGYLDWLSMAPEGKFPMRPEFVAGWGELEFGVDRRAPINSLYSQDTIDNILEGVQNFDRWGFAAGKGALITSIYSTKTVPQSIARMLNDEITPVQAAAEIDQAVKAL